jgi:hypothetical protein
VTARLFIDRHYDRLCPDEQPTDSRLDAHKTFDKKKKVKGDLLIFFVSINCYCAVEVAFNINYCVSKMVLLMIHF